MYAGLCQRNQRKAWRLTFNVPSASDGLMQSTIDILVLIIDRDRTVVLMVFTRPFVEEIQRKLIIEGIFG